MLLILKIITETIFCTGIQNDKRLVQQSKHLFSIYCIVQTIILQILISEKALWLS